MRARHHQKLRGEAHRARGGGVTHHHPHNVIKGEGAVPKLHAGKRARGGGMRLVQFWAGGAVPTRKSGGGIHIKKSHQGLLHKNLGVAKGQHIPAKKLSKALHSSNPAVKKRAVFAENAKHWHHKG